MIVVGTLGGRLSRAERFLRALVEALPEAMVVVDEAGRIVACNRAAERGFGYPREELLGRGVESLVPEGLRDRHAREREAYGRSPRARPMGAGLDIEVQRRDGSRFPADVVLSPFRLGRRRFVLALVLDLTERKRAEEALRAAERRYRTLFEEAPAMYVVNRDEGGVPVVADCNAEFLRTLGYRREEVVGRPLADFYAPASRRALLEGGFRRALEGRFVEEERELVARDGRIVRTLLRAVPETDAQGRVVGTRAMFTDTTALREAEARYREIFEGALEGIYRTSLDGRFLAANPALARILGYSCPEELMAAVTDAAELYVAPRGREAFIRRLAEEETATFEHELRRKDGSTVWVSERARALRDEAGRLVGFEGFVTDITERRRAEEDRRRLRARLVAAQEEERARIASDVHDDPLQKVSAVGMRLAALRRRADDPELATAVGELEETVAVATRSLRNLLFELRPPALDREGLAAALRQLLAEEAREAGFTYRLEDRLVEEPPPDVRAVAYRVAQEALTNVRKHARARTVEVLLEPWDGGLRVRVRDDGVGFDPAAVSETVPGHLGLGSMRERVELADGWWRVRSAPGAGTAVEFWLPAASREPPPAAATPAERRSEPWTPGTPRSSA